MNHNKIVEHYIKISQNLRDGNLSAKEVENIMSRDAQAYLSMKNKALITQVEFDSILATMSEFEDLFHEIIALKQELKKRSNGKVN